MKKILICLTSVFLILSLCSCEIISDIAIKIQGKDTTNDDTQKENSSFEQHFCGQYFPDDYDLSSRIYLSGIRDFDEKRETYILLNIEEVYEAIELLKKNGSRIKESVLLDCESLGYDVFYLFHFTKKNAEELKDGKGYFDRRIDDGIFTCRIYYNEHTIEEIKSTSPTSPTSDWRIYSFSQTYMLDFAGEDVRRIVDNIDSFVVTTNFIEYGYPLYILDYGRKEIFLIKVGEDVCMEIEARIGSKEEDCVFMLEDIQEIVKTITIIEAYDPELEGL